MLIVNSITSSNFSSIATSTMKLIIRSFETKQIFKIEVPSSSCTLQELKNHIFQALPSSSSTANSIHLSLNRKDELQASEEDTLQSMGIKSGDLIYFTHNPIGVSMSTETHSPKSKNLDTQIAQESEKVKNLDTQVVQESGMVKNLDTQVVRESGTVKNLETQIEKLEPQETKPVNLMEDFMEVDDNGDYSDVDFTKSFSIPGFLRKVFTKELNDDDGSSEHKPLVVAVHAVFVESGFVLLDPLTFTEVSVSQFLKYRSLRASGMTLFYTLPEVIDHVKQGDCNVIDSVEIKFQSLEKSFIAHGSLSGGGGGEVSVSIPTRRVTLNEDQLVPFLNVVWANCGLHEVVDGDFGEKEVFVFWRNVKDGLVLPLLIDLCEKSGLVLPPCFTGLPNDLKLKILESLPGVDIARVSCLSTELRNLGSSDDLWKKKYVEQFGDGAISGEGGHWKEKFVKSWDSRIWKSNVKLPPTCPRCDSTNTKFCYFNNYSLAQPRYFCKVCRRYWTKGGSLRNVPIGGGCRKSRRGKSSSSSSSTSHQHGLISRNLGHGVCLNHTNIDHNQSNSNSLDHHGPNIDLALVYANFLNSDNSKPSQLEDRQNVEVSDDLLLPNQEGVLVTPAFEFSSVINNMEFLNSNLGQESQLIGDGDGVYFCGIHEEKQNTMNHSDVHDDHYTNMNNVINHDQLGNNYMELPPFPGEEMIWSNSHDHHDHMVFPNDILNTSHNLSIGGLEPDSEPELAVQDPSHNHNENNANDGSVFNLSNFGNNFRPYLE